MQTVGEHRNRKADFYLFVCDMVGIVGWDERMFTPFRATFVNTPFYHCAGNHEDVDHMFRFIGAPAALNCDYCICPRSHGTAHCSIVLCRAMLFRLSSCSMKHKDYNVWMWTGWIAPFLQGSAWLQMVA